MAQLTSAMIRSQAFNLTQSSKVRDYLIDEYSISGEDLETIMRYMQSRKAEIKGKESFGIVYVLTKTCNLNCLHCGVNAKLLPSHCFVIYSSGG